MSAVSRRRLLLGVAGTLGGGVLGAALVLPAQAGSSVHNLAEPRKFGIFNWRAVCPCGWKGPSRMTKGGAWNDVDTNKRLRGA